MFKFLEKNLKKVQIMIVFCFPYKTVLHLCNFISL